MNLSSGLTRALPRPPPAQGVNAVGGALIDNTVVGAPPTVIVSPVLQIAVEKVDPTAIAEKPFSVPGSAAGVGMPNNVAALDGLAEVGTVLWSSSADVRGVDMGNSSLGSPTLSFTLKARSMPATHMPPCTSPTDFASLRPSDPRGLQSDGKELVVKDLETGIGLKLDLNEPIDPKKTCVGPPTGAGLFESAQAGNSPCAASEVCNYFNEELGEYSTDGCETVPTTDGSMSCVCNHLSEFVSLKVC